MTPHYNALEITKNIGSRKVLDCLSLEISEGEFFLLLGPSGSGKTTLLRILAGLETPNHGQLFFRDRDVTKLPPEERNLGFVFQNYALWPHLSVAQNITFGLEMQRASKSEQSTRLKEVLALVQLDGFADRFPHQLSGGQQQRVALARALAPRPRLLLLDEPLSNLDASLRRAIRAELKALHRSCRLTTICVTHDREDAFALADRIGVLVDGRLDQVGTPHEVYKRPSSLAVARVTGDTNVLKGDVVSATPDTNASEKRWLVTCRVSNSLIHAVSCSTEAPQGTVAVLSRPENWCLVPPAEIESVATEEPQDHPYRIQASTLEITFEGERNRIDAIINDQQPLHLYHKPKEPKPEMLPQGAINDISSAGKITIGYSPDSLLVFPESP